MHVFLLVSVPQLTNTTHSTEKKNGEKKRCRRKDEEKTHFEYSIHGKNNYCIFGLTKSLTGQIKCLAFEWSGKTHRIKKMKKENARRETERQWNQCQATRQPYKCVGCDFVFCYGLPVFFVHSFVRRARARISIQLQVVHTIARCIRHSQHCTYCINTRSHIAFCDQAITYWYKREREREMKTEEKWLELCFNIW